MKSNFILSRFALLWALAFSASVRAEDALDYSRDILPILSNNCFLCHGQDANTREADLRLDRARFRY